MFLLSYSFIAHTVSNKNIKEQETEEMAELNGEANVSSSAYSRATSGLLKRIRSCKDSLTRRHMFIGIGGVAIILIIVIIASISTTKGKFII